MQLAKISADTDRAWWTWPDPTQSPSSTKRSRTSRTRSCRRRQLVHRAPTHPAPRLKISKPRTTTSRRVVSIKSKLSVAFVGAPGEAPKLSGAPEARQASPERLEDAESRMRRSSRRSQRLDASRGQAGLEHLAGPSPWLA